MVYQRQALTTKLEDLSPTTESYIKEAENSLHIVLCPPNMHHAHTHIKIIKTYFQNFGCYSSYHKWQNPVAVYG